MQLTTKGRYAVMALIDLVKASEPVSLHTIAKKQNLSQAYLEQLFGKLRRSGIVKSNRGVNGGYTLGKSAGEINIYEVLCATDKPVVLTQCQGSKDCQRKGAKCKTHDLWTALAENNKNFLEKISLEDVCENRL